MKPPPAYELGFPFGISSFLLVALVLIFLLQDVVEEDPHIYPVPTESYFQFQLMNIYGTASMQN